MRKFALFMLVGVSVFLLSGCATAPPQSPTFGPLYMAVIKNDINEVSRLIDAGADVNEPQMANFTALRGASQLGRIDIAKLLISKGANVNSIAIDKSTPLMAAAQFKQTEMYNLLIANGADVSMRDALGKTALDFAPAGSELPQAAMVVQQRNAAPLPLPNTINPSTPISGNGGKYMSPFTASGAVAVWAQKRVATTDNGSDVAGAVGGYVGKRVADKALDFVPFGLGGMFASKAGDAAGRAVTRKTIEPALPTQYEAKASSDISFDSVDELAVYIYSKNSAHPEYARVLAVATQVYPELRDTYTQAIQTASQLPSAKKNISPEERLKALQQLKADGLISEPEFQSKRSKILESL